MTFESPSEREIRAGTLVIADLHLDAAELARPAAFAAWLDAFRDLPGLLILGDLFDAWVGPAHARLPGARQVFDALARLSSRGTVIELIPGNRDFLLDSSFERATGATLLQAGLVGDVPGGPRALFIHGDELCTLDHAYQRLRRVIRSKAVRWLAPRVPLSITTRFAARLRRASVRAIAAKPAAEKEMQPGACRAFAQRASAEVLVCGHAHEARDEELAGGPRWIVLDAFGGERDALRVQPGGELLPCASGVRGLEPLRYGPREELPSLPSMTIIAIDGPAGAGKSSVSRALAAALGLAFLDTGAMYRGIALAGLRRDVPPADAAGCERLARELSLEFDAEGRLVLDGELVDPAIRAPEVDAVVSEVSAHPGVRRALVPQQRAAAAALGGVVAEGRDMGTVVFPDASHKFFLTAGVDERARRRLAQRGGDGSLSVVREELERRDHFDSTRADSPLAKAGDAEEIDTDGLDREQVVERMLERVRSSVQPQTGR